MFIHILPLLPFESSNSVKNTLERLDPQLQNNQFKLYVKQLVCGKWIKTINRIGKQSKLIKNTSTAENKRQR